MERRPLRSMSRARSRPFGRGHDRRAFAEAAAREQIRKLKGGANPLSAFVAAVGSNPINY